MVEKLVRWALFGVVIALLPIAFSGFKILHRGEAFDHSLLLSDGELLLVSAGIAAAAIGEIVASGANAKILKVVCGAGATALLMISSFSFADIASLSPTLSDGAAIAAESLWIFAFTVLSGASCIILSEVRE